MLGRGWGNWGPIGGGVTYMVEGVVHDMWFLSTSFGQFDCFIVIDTICVGSDFTYNYVVQLLVTIVM